MAIHLEANYSKKLGLPGYSSHQYSLTVSTEVTDLALIQAENNRLYALLQTCVDSQIHKTGYLPDSSQSAPAAIDPATSQGQNQDWACSPKQQDLIFDIVQEHNLDWNEIEKLAQGRFGKGVKQLNKPEASGLIQELLADHGKANGSYRRPDTTGGSVRNGGAR
jgi:hypothetical protein